MAKRIKNNVVVFLMIFSLIIPFAQPVFATGDMTKYDAEKSVKWAKEHIASESLDNPTCGLVCDQFVKECLKAGGVDIQAGDVTPVMEALVEAGFGEMIDVILTADGKYVNKADNPKLKAGDVLSFYCNTCGDHSHTVLIAGFDSEGNAQTYGHNKTWDLVTTVGNYTHTEKETGITHADGYSLDAIVMSDEQFHAHQFVQKDSSDKWYYDAEHPHEMYAKCGCGVSYHLGWNAKVSSCAVCNPPQSDIPQISLTLNSDMSVSLKWTTITDVDYFTIMRASKYDGEYSELKSKGEVVKVKGTTFKNSSTKKEPGKEFFYKIKAVKKDGSFVYSYVASIIINPGEEAHVHVIDKAVEPTCAKVGWTEGRHCSICGATFVKQEEVPKKDHTIDKIISNGDGTATVYCKVCGPIEVIDELYRVKGKSRYETSIAIANATKEKHGVEKFDTIIVANGENFADALAGSYLAKVKTAPILMASGRDKDNAVLKEYIETNLSAGGTVYILGGTGAVKQSTEDAIKTIPGITIKRLKDKDRYGTNITILKEAGVTGNEILVATGESFADSLSASAVGKPILLVNGKKGELTATQKEFLNSLGNKKFYILGGTGAVSANFETLLSTYGEVERVKGKSRYETSVAIAEKFFDTPESAVLAYAWNFPDGLSGGPLAMAMDAPLILTKTGRDSATAKAYVQANGIKSGAVLGGASLIDDATATDIFDADGIIIK